MLTRSIWLFTMQKMLKTQSVKSMEQHYLGSNQSPNQHIANPLVMKYEERNQNQDELYIPKKNGFSKMRG